VDVPACPLINKGAVTGVVPAWVTPDACKLPFRYTAIVDDCDGSGLMASSSCHVVAAVKFVAPTLVAIVD
jgi:hypothetical protein